MTYTPLYVPLATFKSWLDITDTARDTDLLMVLQAAEEQVELKCNRKFTLDATPTARVFDPEWGIFPHHDGDMLQVDDIGIATPTVGGYSDLTVEYGSSRSSWVDITSWIDTAPMNAILGTDPRPISGLIYVGMTYPRGVGYRIRVTARWGYPAIPARVMLAIELMASKWWKRKGSPEGVIGSADWGAIRVIANDPDVSALLGPLARM